MKINFSRHAKRRGKLYKISEEMIKNIEGFKYPIKIIISVENNIITIITNYPLKRGMKK